MINFFGQLRDEFICKVVQQEREETIVLDENELHLTTRPKDSFGVVRDEHREIIGNVYGYGSRDSSREECIEQAKKTIDNRLRD